MYIFIVNPVSGNGKSQRAWKKIRKYLDKQHIKYRSFTSKYPGHAEEIAKQVSKLHDEKVKSVIAVGGDGTFHEVVNGLEYYPDMPLGYIPCGSGNDAARGFYISRSPLRALKNILKQSNKPRSYDVGQFHFPRTRKPKRVFINGIGIGFDGEVAKMTNTAKYKAWLNRIKLGHLSYAISFFRLVFKYKPSSVDITIDGKKHHFSHVWLIAVCNIPFYGGGMKIAPQAKANDGILDICIVHDLHPWKLFFVFGTVFFGWHQKFKEVHMLRGRWIEVKPEQPLLAHADGEIIGNAPVFISVNDNKRKILI